jgi:2-dehydro-3-deoxy-D-gluconate 5-dehydrogenase
MKKVVRPWKASSLRVDGKTALVVGAGGLGRAIALGLSDAGATVVVGDVVEAAAAETAAEIAATGARSLATAVDISRPPDSESAVRLAAGTFGRLDILVNAVGIINRSPSLEVTEDDWDHVSAVNLKGAFFCAQAAAKAFVAQGTGGKIIMLSSHMGSVGSPLPRAAYAATKGGMNNLVRALACEWAAEDINVNGLAPIYTRTALNERALNDPFYHDLVLGRLRIKRLGEPEDIVGAAVFLASEASNFVTGQILSVDGGWFSW